MADDFKDLGFVPDEGSKVDTQKVEEDHSDLGFVPEVAKPIAFQPNQSQQSTAPIAPVQKPNILQSIIQGGAGALKVPAAGLKAGLDTLTTPTNTGESLLDKFGKNYQAANQQITQEQQEASKAHPIATTIGQMSAMAPVMAEAAPTIAAQTSIGGLMGLLGSSAKNPSELASDVGEGGLLSAGLTAGLKGLGSVAGSIKEAAEPYVRDIPYLRQLVVAAKTGNTAIGDEARQALVNGETQTAQDLANNVVNGDKLLAQNIEDKIQRFAESGNKIELEPQVAEDMKKFLSENRTRLSPKDYKSLMNQVSQFGMDETISPVEFNNFKKEFQQATTGFTNPDTIDIKNNILNGINNPLQKIPGYQDANKLFHDYRDSVAETLLNEGKDNPRYLSDMANWPEALKNKFQDMFQTLGFAKESANPSVQSLSEMKNNLTKFGEQYPGELERLGIDPDHLINTIKSQADASAVRIRQTGEGGGAGLMGKAVGMVTGAPMNMASMVGKATRGSAQIINRFNSASNPELEAAGQRLIQDPDLKYLGDSLVKSIHTNNEFLKNAAVFKILQNPRARAILGGHSDEK